MESATFRLLAPVDAPLIAHSSPHVCTTAQFAARFIVDERRRLLWDRLDLQLNNLRRGGLTPSFLMVGGGFVRPQHTPRDLDALIGYSVPPPALLVAETIEAMRTPVEGLDLRFVPIDVGPVVLVRMACFFHTLYQSRNQSLAQPSFLIALEE